jgi:hypothetical protein
LNSYPIARALSSKLNTGKRLVQDMARRTFIGPRR